MWRRFSFLLFAFYFLLSTSSVNIQEIGPYRLLRQIGSGGAAQVFVAEDPRLRRRVAVKLLSRQLTQDPEQVERFQQEAEWMSMLSHPNLLTILEVGEQDGRHYIVSEYIQGQSLRSRLARGPLPLRQAVGIAIGIARGLSAAHELWIVHRDLKPENVMLWADDHVKLLDFGVAKLIGSSKHTTPGMVLGTLQYLAPEQVRGEGVDPRTDLWAVGILLWEMVTGRNPFEVLPLDQLFAAIREARVPDLAESSGETIPEGVRAFLGRTLVSDPEGRYGSAAGMLKDLHDAHDEIICSERHRKSE